MKNKDFNQKRAVLNIGLVLLFFFLLNDADAQTQQKLKDFYNWLKPIINVILAILTIGAVGRAVYKTFFKHQEAGMEWGFVVIGLVLWGLWITFANEIIVLMGGDPVQF